MSSSLLSKHRRQILESIELGRPLPQDLREPLCELVEQALQQAPAAGQARPRDAPAPAK